MSDLGYHQTQLMLECQILPYRLPFRNDSESTLPYHARLADVRRSTRP
jgi:hypothetical protein